MKRQAVFDALATAINLNICSVCNTPAKWLLPSIDDTDELEIMAMVAPSDITRGFQFAPLICLNCGATQLFHLDSLMKGQVEKHE